jgi:peptidoglycan hydrolase-like protein with peptidoglycan-binding domain
LVIQRFRYVAVISMLLMLVCPSFARTKKTKHASHSSRSHRMGKKSAKTKPGAWKRKGQHEIEDERASAIQQALIREHYLSGSATGTWDDSTRAAMARYQADHGWQSKRIPDARALIKLGLGPNRTGALTPNASELAASPALPASDAGMVGAPQQ